MENLTPKQQLIFNFLKEHEGEGFWPRAIGYFLGFKIHADILKRLKVQFTEIGGHQYWYYSTKKGRNVKKVYRFISGKMSILSFD